MDEGRALDAGSDADFRYIYEETISMLFKISYRIVFDADAAEDLCHDALIKAAEKHMQFPSINDAKFWLIRVTKNNSLNFVKRKSRERNAYTKVFNEHKNATDKTGERRYLEKESIALVKSALSQLPDKLKEVIVLKEYSDLNYKEIGKILGISEGNVKVRIFRARKVLQTILGGSDDGKASDSIFMPCD